ncbi:MAG: RsmD family RNA methyltransferase, partial [Candidatus Heimdallarchaeota archaeon]|nr:RsmD family RNA methyltransferase [Candidatus Heimdallarchaeota archaeon]
NLLHPFDAIILDPFCGHGGILREIADVGSYAIGIEVSKKVTRELLENNRHFGYDDRIEIIMGDSLHPPYRGDSFDQAVTDPPYAIQTTTIGRKPDDLLSEWIENQNENLVLVFTTPKEMLSNLPDNWVIDIDADDYVHRSLTRRIRRMKKKGV